MALHNDPRLYTAGAVVAPQPNLNLYANVLARQQAKAEAMDNYERSRINSVNDAGVRDQDRKSLDDQMASLRSFYQGNKQAIQRGNTKEAFDYEKMFRDVRDFIAQSKDRSARRDAALKFYNERLKTDQRLPDDFMVDLHSNDMPVGSKYMTTHGEYKDYEPFDIAKWSSEPKPFTLDKYLAGFKDIKRVPSSPTYKDVLNNPLKKEEITTESFDDNAKQVIAARALDKYDNSYSFSSQVNSDIQDPVRRKQLNDVFVKEFGTQPASIPDYAIAYTMEKIQPTLTKSKIVDDKESIAKMNDKLSRGRIALRDYYAKQRIDQRYERDVRNILASDTNFDEIWKTVGTNLPENLVKKVYGSPKDEKGHAVPPPEVTLSPDGQTYNFTVYTDGKPDPNYSKSVPAAVVKTQMKQDLSNAIKTKTTLPSKTDQKYSDVTSGTFKGKRVQIGMKNGKWYNIQTGEEIK